MGLKYNEDEDKVKCNLQIKKYYLVTKGIVNGAF